MENSGFDNNINNLKNIYEKLNDDNKNKLEEAILMVLTKFQERL